MVLRFFLLAAAFFFVSCSDLEFNNPYDPDSPNYIGNQSSSSSESVPVSSSSKPSSSSSIPSSSSVPVQTEIIYGKSVEYKGETYQTVLIGSQTWFKRNLNYNVEGSKCGGEDGKLKDENTSYCDTYGRLYDWATAMNLPSGCNSNSCSSLIGTNHRGICPSGWHLPSNADWDKLMTAVGGSSTAGKYLKAREGWNSGGNGEDKYGFSALPGGYGYSHGSFSNVGYDGYWWSASEDISYYAYSRDMYYNLESAYWDYNYKDGLFSVRCLQD